MNFSEILTYWYSANKRNLPWRQTKDPYYIWLSEIILQQTQIKQGLPYYKAFVTNYPSIFDLAKATESEILKLWQGLGYYSRARNLLATAKFVVDELDGKFPDNYKDLLKLKGVGDYTASAIASICFNEATAVVDGNVYRVLARFYGIDTPINSTKGIKEFKQLAQELIDVQNPAGHNQAIMDFGARQCKPQNPNCTVCPLKKACLACLKNKIQDFPVKLKTAKVKHKNYNFLVFISEDEKTIMEQRKGNGIWENLYQFPLVETQNQVTFEEFEKHIKKDLLLKGSSFELIEYNDKAIVHKLSHQHLHTKFWIVKTRNLPSKGIPFKEVRNYPVPILIGKFIESFNF